jgi:hypothetical protein
MTFLESIQHTAQRNTAQTWDHQQHHEQHHNYEKKKDSQEMHTNHHQRY